uniref:Uncharacterized protein n=1 Tax=Phaseolus vulgaris TaxID=3885 RepID=V7AWQ7_PHAVU|nr:hypothetical protein PHAVU_009G149900g [Phaseolus vulgaris]ESW09710.1 hypothetical protein PHAVU_009G149900g [Phaseolus vulgaris]
MTLLVHVFCLVDGKRKTTMGYIYEAMKKVKETKMKSFNNNGNNEDEGNKLVFDDDPTLNWATVYEVSVGETIIYTRRQATNKRKQPSSGGIVIEYYDTSKKGSGGVQLQPNDAVTKFMLELLHERKHKSSNILKVLDKANIGS